MIYALDFSMRFNLSKITYHSIVNYQPGVLASANYNTSNSTLYFTSFAMTVMPHDTPIVAVRFNLLLSPVTAADFNTVLVYLNGDACSYKIIPPVLPATIGASATTVATGDSVLLSANAGSGLTYLWSTGATSQSIYANTPGNYVVTVTTAGGCTSSAAISISQSSLPVELLYFRAEEIDNAVLLSWSTATEINNNYFTIERASDGSDWRELAKIPGAGNSTTERNYSSMDYAPFTGVNYYRLKQTDFDGAFTYSETAALVFREGLQNFSVSVFPNPANEIVNVTVSENGTAQLLSMDGSKVFAFDSVRANQKMQINTSALESGIYMLRVYNDNFMSMKKVVIQK